MPSSKITQLPLITQINANTSNTLFVGVDVPTLTTGQLTVQTLAAGLYSNSQLAVGNNIIILPNTIAQFSGNVASYMQINEQNFNPVGTSDFILTADTGTDSGGYVDLGINNSQWNPVTAGQTSQYPLDGYLIVDGPGSNTTGNLVIGTANPGTNVVFAVGGYYANNITAYITANGIVLPANSYIQYPDGSIHRSSNSAYLAAAFAQANSAAANSIYQTGVNAIQNTQIQLAWNEANTAVQNTAVVRLQSLTLTGNLIANSAGQGIFVDKFTSNSATFSQNMVVLGNLSANTLLGNIFFSNVVTTTSQSNSILWFPQAGTLPQQTAQLWYYSNTQSLILDTDIAGDRLSISKVLFFRGYNNTGSTIPANSVVRLVPGVTANQIPYIALADATNSANATVAGFVKNAIANGAYGFAYSQGIVEDLNSTGLGQNGDILFLSTTPGLASNVAPQTSNSNTVVQLGRVILSDATQGKLFIQNQLRQAYGRPNGSVLYAYANNINSSNTISINDSTGTFTANIIVANTLISITDFVSGNVTANTVIANTFVYGSATANSGVTQLTSRTTSVTANGITGTIIGYSGSALMHGTGYVFTVNNSYVQHTNDIVFVSVQNSNCPVPQVSVANTRVGSFDVCVFNGSGAGNDAAYTMNINFGIIRVGS